MSQPLAGLLLAAAAKQAGSLAARALLRRISKSNHGEPGDVVKIALRLREEAHEVLARAVVYERARGTSWATIGAVLGITRQSAFKQYQDAERALRRLSETPADDLQRLADRIENLREVVAGKGNNSRAT